jgi:hypothetical protein
MTPEILKASPNFDQVGSDPWLNDDKKLEHQYFMMNTTLKNGFWPIQTFLEKIHNIFRKKCHPKIDIKIFT